MQEEVTQKTVTFCVRTTKMTADVLKKVIAAYLRHQKQKSAEKKAQKNQPKQGKITVKEHFPCLERHTKHRYAVLLLFQSCF